MLFEDQVTHSADVEVIQPLAAPDLNKAVPKALAEAARAMPKRHATQRPEVLEVQALAAIIGARLTCTATIIASIYVVLI